MTYLRLLLAIFFPFWLGLGVVALVYRSQNISFLERCALAWGIGLGLLGMSMYTLALLGLRLTPLTSALPAIVVIIGLTSVAWLRKVPLLDINSALEAIRSLANLFSQPNKPKAILEKLLVLLVILAVCLVFFDALIRPIVNFDDLWRQGSIAKIIFTTGLVQTKQSLELAGPHPYLNPLSQAWIYFAIGAWNDALGKIVFAGCFTALLLAFYTSLKRYTSRFNSLFFTFLLTSFPLIVYHAGTAYSDLMLTCYYSIGVFYLFHWLKKQEAADLYAAALMLSAGNFVKQTGILLWLITIVVLFIFIFLENRKALRTGGNFILISTALSFPWLLNPNSSLFSAAIEVSRKFGTWSAGPAANSAGAQLVKDMPYLPPTIIDIVYNIGKRMFTYADWQLLWLVFFLVLFLDWQRIWRTAMKYLLLTIVLFFGMIIYMFSEYGIYKFLLDGTLVERAMMWQVPIVLYFAALASASFLKDDKLLH
jgi:4-amino-4-deoxy-L-arabinose transferase-like glycosyltransferase